MRRDRFDENFERILKLLLSDEAVELVRSLSLEKLRMGDIGEEEKFRRIVEAAERLAREIDEEMVSMGKRLFDEGGNERAGAYLLVFGRLVDELINTGLYDHAIRLNAKIPWWNECEFRNPKGTPETEEAHFYTRWLNWIRMIHLSWRAAETFERNITQLDEFDRAVIACTLSNEDEEAAGRIYPNIHEAKRKEQQITEFMCGVFEPEKIVMIREKLPGRAKPKYRELK
ncbi:MAG: hypothetical protein QXN15_00205 [Candidatus Jordarchaeales archaeon]|nr:hypothetical protein [Candidatus Jordarchaeia archaeon]